MIAARIYKKHGGEFKAKVLLEAIKEQKSAGYGLADNMA
jgi:hypothetical protein